MSAEMFDMKLYKKALKLAKKGKSLKSKPLSSVKYTGENQIIADLEETINKLREQLALRYGLEDKIKELEKENVELKTERGCETCTKFDEVKLTKAKEIIKAICEGYSSTEVSEKEMIKRIQKAEAFLKE